METRLFRPQPPLVAEALVSRMKQLVPCLAAVCLLPLSTSCAGSPGLIPPVTTKQHESELCHIRIGRYLAPAWSTLESQSQSNSPSRRFDLLCLYFPHPQGQALDLHSVSCRSRRVASYSAQRDDTAVVRAPCLLTIRRYDFDLGSEHDTVSCSGRQL